MSLKISVIVPAYNAEKFIDTTIEDLRNQTYSNLEIIIVNDGSTDHTLDICENKAKLDNRIRVITKENGGAPSARNAGLSVALGDYVGFMDADDRMDPEMYEFLAKTAEENNSDMVVCSYKEEYSDNFNIIEHHDPNYNVTFFKGRSECLKAIDNNKNMLTTFTWNKVFRRSLIGELRFTEDMRIMDDILFVYGFVSKANSIQKIDVPCYHYKCVMTSLTKASYTSKYFRDFERIEELIKWSELEAPECSNRLKQRYLYWNAKSLETMIRNYNADDYRCIRNNIRKYKSLIKTLPSWEKYYVSFAEMAWPLYRFVAEIKLLRKRVFVAIKNLNE